ncbi:MAG: VWA domain-containing protein [Gammaproteobacteria bacterium]|nr:MAG: VWA domain-containing protein [Gammaproteobacteria bacterium]|tara:strand:- start:5873 stop:7672 length:1800 start_codon:yes stop_codon:yes gene_type:complete
MIETDFHFIRPLWLIMIPFIFFLIIVFKKRRLSVGNWGNIIDKKLIPYVLHRDQLKEDPKKWWLFTVTGILAVIAMAGPTWEKIQQPSFRADQALVIALDLSRSMNAQDLSPNRLTRGKLKILDILERRRSAQVALIVYSANAFTVTPLTSDSDTIISLINSLDTTIMPSRGSYPSAAIEKGIQLLKQAGASNGEILLVTDGGITSDAFDSVEKLKNEGYKLSVLGVGTEDGAPIPKESGGFVIDNSGQIAIARLEIEDLIKLASIGGGTYTNLTSNDQDINMLLSERVLDAEESDESLATDQWYEFGPWLLLLIVPLSSLFFRRGWVFILIFTVLPYDNQIYAFEWIDLWKTKNQQAKEAFDNGDYDTAVSLFTDPKWLAAANYDAKNFQKSAQIFNSIDDGDSLYNYANSLAKSGQLKKALEIYNEVIDLENKPEDAIYNRDLIMNLLKEQESKGENDNNEQSSNEGSSGDNNQDEISENSQETQNESSSEDGNNDDQNELNSNREQSNEEDIEAIERELEKAADNSENELQENTSNETEVDERMVQEQEQALEQWLRRIPDDPGGLLRRKFRYQYQRQGVDQDGNQIWPGDGAQPW